MAAEPRSQSDAYRLRWISARWRGVALDSIDADAVAELIDERDGETSAGLAPATVNRWLAQIVAILNVAIRRGWLDKLPTIDHRASPPGRTQWLTGEQWIALRDALPLHLRQMARFSIATGLRRHNVTHLQWDQIDMARRVAWIHPDQTKAGNAIGVPLTDDAVTVLAEQRGQHDVLVFPWRGLAVFKTSTKAWHKATAAAGVPWCRWHDLRHTWASWHVQNGTRIEELMQLGGWKTLSMVQRYAHLSPEHLQRVADNARPVERRKA